ncbi:MAG: trimethylamine methyltransferase family protein [Candidatus Eisenbacteria bacterium]|nr:trimethylamine methyltransferase family protein [Candidatus Eisenbacteria bacterium]
MSARTLEVPLKREDVLHFLGYRGRGAPAAWIEAGLGPAMEDARALIAPRGVSVSPPAEAVLALGLQPRVGARLELGLVTVGPALGKRVVELLERGEPTRALLLDASGSAAVEEAADALEGTLHPGPVPRRFSPGYGDWPLEAQRGLFPLLPHAELGVQLLPSCLMSPHKSISFAVWVGGEEPRGVPSECRGSRCASCGWTTCPYRHDAPPEGQPGGGTGDEDGGNVMSESLRPKLTLFPEAEPARIVEEGCRVLETVGVRVENDAGRRLLSGAGARETNGRHHIPETLVRASLAGAPGRLALHDVRGGLACDLGGDRVHFDPGSAAIHVLDAGTGRRREATTADVIRLVQLVDRLPLYAAQSTALLPSDVPRELGDRFRLYLALRHGSKPVITGTFLKDGFAPMRDMLAVVRGGAAELAARPLAVFDCCPSPPLKWSDLTCQSLLDCARSGIPAELISMPLTGATSPVTLREAVVQHCAESLSGVVLHQLACPGAPIVWGGAPSAFDMRHGTTPMGAVETMMICVGYAQVGKSLGLPVHGYLGLSDAKTPDYQAGLESGIGAVLAALAGIHMVSGPGALDYILTQSLEKLVLDHEACAMALRLARGIARHGEDPVALIAELVDRGEFLSHEHTRAHWREELSVPSAAIDRQTYGDWEASGAKTALDRARAEVERLLSREKPPALPEDRLAALDEVMAAEARRVGWTLPRA